jgi:hypothetical protein
MPDPNAPQEERPRQSSHRPELGQASVELRDDRGTFADGSADALDRAAPDVAHREDARDVRLQ